jgi:DNA gyrase subunit A
MGLHADKGKVVAAEMVSEDDQLFLVNDSGVTIRVPVSGISTQSRDATGVRVMNLDEDTRVVAAARVPVGDEDDDDGDAGGEDAVERAAETDVAGDDPQASDDAPPTDG